MKNCTKHLFRLLGNFGAENIIRLCEKLKGLWQRLEDEKGKKYSNYPAVN